MKWDEKKRIRREQRRKGRKYSKIKIDGKRGRGGSKLENYIFFPTFCCCLKLGKSRISVFGK